MSRRTRVVIAVTALGAAGGGLLAGILAVTGHAIAIGFVAVLLLPALLARRRESSIVILVLGATLFEQFPIDLGPGHLGDGTSQVPFFTGLGGAAGISGIGVNPMELVLASVLVTWLVRALAQRELRLPRSNLGLALLALLGLALAGLAVGLGHGGDSNAALWELRPFVYLVMTYLLASQLLRDERALWAVLWALIIGTGIKGLQGSYLVVATRGLEPRPEALLAHEESFFFGIFVVITLCLWLFEQKGRLRTVATALLPFVLLANLGNHRRLAWLILALAIAAVVVLAYVRLPERRPLIRRATALGLLAGTAWTFAFWNNQGTLGQPARAVRSVVSPSERDMGSDAYRVTENQNLGINIRRWAPVGAGFGVPIDEVIPIVDISNTDSLIRFVPHDTVLWLWMRLGWQGIFALFWVVSAALISGCQVARSPNPRLAMVAVVCVAAMPAYLALGYEDLGLFWFRVAIVMGCLLGALEAAYRMHRAAEPAIRRRPRVWQGTGPDARARGAGAGVRVPVQTGTGQARRVTASPPRPDAAMSVEPPRP